MNKTEPRTLPGFMELYPKEQVLFDKIKNTIIDTYKSYGFYPIDTPVIELSEVLLAKAGGETEKQIYRFNKGDNDLSLRFDLTVPLAKYVAKNYANLAFPFKRYQIGKVYRGERPQKGRYREFYQCDIDVIGDESLDVINDAEMPAVIYDIFSKLNFGRFQIRINNRKILNGLSKELGIEDKAKDVLVIIDKLAKIGEENVRLTLKDYEIDDDKIDRIMSFITIKGSNQEIINQLENQPISNEVYREGLEELKQVIRYAYTFGVPEENLGIDLTISRGLDYYTGTVYETFLLDHPEIGSVCSGGRYENLAENYTDRKLPGVGISIGLTRLFYIINELNLIDNEKTSISDLLILPMMEDKEASIKLASELRKRNLNVEVYLNDKKLKAKMKYADRLNVKYIIVLGEDEINNNKLKIKNMITGEEVETEINYDKIVELIKK